MDLLGGHRFDLDDLFGSAGFHQLRYNPLGLFSIPGPVNLSPGTRAVALELFQIEVKIGHRMLANLTTALAKLLPVRHLADDKSALPLDHLCCMPDVLPQLGI